MFDGFLSIELTTGVFPVVLDVLGLIALAAVFAIAPTRVGLVRRLIAAASGLVVGLIVCWLISDVFDVFGIVLTLPIRLWFSGTVAAIAVAIVTLISVRRWVRAVPIVGILIFAMVGAIGINADIGEFPTLGAALGIESYSAQPLPSPVATPTRLTDAQVLAAWRPPANLPAAGRVNSVAIPGTISGFHARNALVYLPPAAVVAHPPRLPVLMMMSGQPGSPSTVVTAGQIEKTFDAYARVHRGISPIVVIPDQLAHPLVNPMCVDSSLGNSATYLTVDVPRWIRSNLNVMTDRTTWAIGGFSQGGTCAIQLGAGYPQLFGSILDISGELKPGHGNPAQSIRKGFGGSASAYEKSWPANVLSARAPYGDTLAIFAAGANDSRYDSYATTLAADARSAGMSVQLLVSPGTAHDWHTVNYAFVTALPFLGRRMGIVD